MPGKPANTQRCSMLTLYGSIEPKNLPFVKE